jgi:hypothetical protein
VRIRGYESRNSEKSCLWDTLPTMASSSSEARQRQRQAAETWASATLGSVPPTLRAVRGTVQRDDDWHLDDALDDWRSMSDVASVRSHGSMYRQRVESPVGALGGFGTLSTTSVSDAQTVLHDLYHNLQRQQQAHHQPLARTHAARPPSPPTPPVEQLPGHVRSGSPMPSIALSARPTPTIPTRRAPRRAHRASAATHARTATSLRMIGRR